MPNIIKRAESEENIKRYTYLSDFSVDGKEEKPDDIPEYPETVDIFEDALKQTEEMLEKARQEAEDIRSQAQKEGYERGYEQGLREGHDQAYNDYKIKLDHEMQQFQQEIKEAIESVTTKKEEILEKYMDDLKRVTLTIAEKVIQTSLKSSSEVIKRMILAATSKLKKTQWAKIYITSNSSGIMARGDAALLRELGHLSDNIKIIAMESEEDGTCIIELPDEVIDASVSTQLENIRDILNNARL